MTSCISINVKTIAHCILSLALVAIAIIPDARAASSFESLRTLWRSGDYNNAAVGLLDYQGEPYGKDFEVFYMIGTSLCRINHAPLGIDYLDSILKNFNPNPDERDVVGEQRQLCTAADMPVVAPVQISFNTTRATAGVSSRSKMYYFVGRDNAVRSIPVEVVREIPVHEFAGRLFPPDQTGKAIETVAGLAGPDAVVESTQHFVLASLANHSRADLQQMGSELDQVFDYFINAFGMRPPDSLISVYLVSTFNGVQQLAESVHGIRVAPQSLGYSYRDDLSMVGYVPTTAIGTLRHELFHLMVRNNFGDIPPWMDEGLAALFEVAELKDGRVMGLSNWRGEVLKQLSDRAPSVRELVDMNWSNFAGGETEESTARLAAIHAKARYLMLFFQEQDRLVRVYKQFQMRGVGADAVTELEKTLDQDLDSVETAFQSWFTKF